MKLKIKSTKIALAASLAAILAGCGAIAPQARTKWEDELKNEGFKALYPPRNGDGIGAVLTYDANGQEVVVLDASTCLKTPAPKMRAAVLTRDEKFEVGASLSAQVAKLLKDKVDVEGMAQAGKEQALTLSLQKPFIQRYETARLKSEIEQMDRNSQCFKSITGEKNVIVFQVLGAEGATYKLTDNSGASIKFTADILNLGKVTPELKAKADGTAALDIDVPMFIGYKAMRAIYLPGAMQDKLEYTEFVLQDFKGGVPSAPAEPRPGEF